MRFAYPSREDARNLTRNERIRMMYFTYAVDTLMELGGDIPQRLDLAGDAAKEHLRHAITNAEKLLQELRVTIPEKQRLSLMNAASDCEFRITPKATPSDASTVVSKEEFKALVDAARVKCRECTETPETCKKCSLYQLLVCILPLDTYDGWFLCPYNVAEWKE